MLQVAAAVWNEIAKTQPLETAWAKKWFRMNQDELTQADQKEYEDLKKKVSPDVAISFQTLRPLLLERKAISRHLQKHPELRQALPEVNSINEAVMLASMDRPLNPLQQKQLEQLLREALT